MLIVSNSDQAMLGFSYFSKIGPTKLRLLEAYFPNLEKAFWASSFDLAKAGLNSKLIGEFISWRPSFNLEATLKELQKEEISWLTWHNPSYPQLLLEISNPPYLLYYKGCFQEEEKINQKIKNRLAVVGSRKHSAYAEKIISELIPSLVSEGIEIVSGLAKGVDALAHQAALDYHGRTIAVLGSGLDAKNIYPRSNWTLAQKIIHTGGLLLSEFPPNTAPLKQNFPQRNRIISGLSQATLLVEAPLKSGALITAEYALDQNREVLAVPGNIFSEFSQGTNNLIMVGAKVVTTSEDILEVFKLEKAKEPRLKKLSVQLKWQPENENEKIIYEIIKHASERNEEITTDEIINLSNLDTATINSTLSILEIKGVAKNEKNGYALN